MTTPASREATGSLQLAQLVDELISRLQAGEPVDLQAFAASHPEHADQLQEVIPALEFLTDLPKIGFRDSPSGEASTAGIGLQLPADSLSGTLGDFRIVREVGRGGMGVVYEAEQISLSRRVALKVLPFAAVLDQRQLQRFKNEAQAAASLKHPNIVQVFSVGCERAVHFYVMEYVQGQTLAQAIGNLRQAADQEPRRESQQLSMPEPGSPTVETERGAHAAISTDGSNHSLEFFRNVAGLGIQAAEALEHAHGMGVVHRDIKPSNLLLDSQGQVFITDFGLAMTGADSNLTMTGDLLGTLRYMSPEQVQAKHGLLDHRTDIYSLGVTLYELLTLRPAFVGADRQDLMRAIVEEDARAPRQLNAAIPKDLETIVLKATAKEAKSRYGTASQLGGDLRRFLQDQPIEARRPSLIERATKWSRRHRAVVLAGAAVLIAALAVFLVLAWNWHQKQTELESVVREHLAAAGALIDPDYVAAAEHVAQAQERLDAAHYSTGPLREAVAAVSEKVQARRHAEEQFNRFQELRQIVRSGMYDSTLQTIGPIQGSCDQALSLYRVFQGTGLHDQVAFQQLDTAKQAALREGIGELLFLWARMEVNKEQPRDMLQNARRRAIEALQLVKEYYRRTPPVYLWVAELYRVLGDQRSAQKAQQEAASPATCALGHFVLAEFQVHYGREDSDAAITSFTEAIRLRPGDAWLYGERSVVYIGRGDLRNAIRDLNEAIRLTPKNRVFNNRRGMVYFASGDFERAAADFTEARKIDPKHPYADGWLGWIALLAGDFDKAVFHHTRAIKVSREGKAWPFVYLTARWYVQRARAYWGKGDFDRAISDCDDALRLAPGYRFAYPVRALAKASLGQLDAAMADLGRTPETQFPTKWPSKNNFVIYGPRGLMV